MKERKNLFFKKLLLDVCNGENREKVGGGEKNGNLLHETIISNYGLKLTVAVLAAVNNFFSRNNRHSSATNFSLLALPCF